MSQTPYKQLLPHCSDNRIVESTDARMFGLEDAEVQRRRRYVGDVQKEIQVRFPFQPLL